MQVYLRFVLILFVSGYSVDQLKAVQTEACLLLLLITLFNHLETKHTNCSFASGTFLHRTDVLLPSCIMSLRSESGLSMSDRVQWIDLESYALLVLA